MKIKYDILSLATLAMLMLSFSGCAYFETYSVSVPTTNTKAKWQSDEKDVWSAKIEYPSLNLHLRPLNDIKTSEWGAIVIIPVYINTRDKEGLAFARDRAPYDRNSEFRILIAMLPKDTDLKLNTEMIKLSIDGVAHSLSGIEGPVPYDPSIQPCMFYEYQPSLAKQLENVKKGYVFSLAKDETKRRTLGIDNMNIFIPKTGLWVCYELIFNCKTPSPEQKINLNIKGLMQGDVAINIPIIEFEKSTRDTSQSIP